MSNKQYAIYATQKETGNVIMRTIEDSVDEAMKTAHYFEEQGFNAKVESETIELIYQSVNKVANNG